MSDENCLEEIGDELRKQQLFLFASTDSYEKLRISLSEIINLAITNNFSHLISVLYRLDISEKKLKLLLSETSDTPAADIIADMIIERQLQKIATRKAFKNNEAIAEEDKW